MIRERDGKEKKREMGRFNVPWWVGEDSYPVDVIGSDKIKVTYEKSLSEVDKAEGT